MAAADPFPASDFDQWAATYDEDVVRYDTFPFAGYESALQNVVQWSDARAGMTVLDLGVGTGNLAVRFAQLGCRLWCVDYSPVMLDKARLKLPGAQVILHDLRDAWPAALEMKFDRIVSGYSLHHFGQAHNVSMISRWARERLRPGGNITIADISFPSAAAQQRFADALGDAWEQEPYWIADEALPALEAEGLNVDYAQVSPCAGVYRIEGR